jgi:hypothetical protein
MVGGTTLEKYEVVVPLRYDVERLPLVTRVRSTLLSASLQGVRSMGFEERYLAQLPKPLHPTIASLVAGTWVPLDLAMAHYTACDRMALTPTEMALIGEEVSLKTQKTFLATVGKAAAGVGVTPWHFMTNIHRIWARIFEGGDLGVYRIGPKEALVQTVGCPLLRIPYIRTAIRAYYRVLPSLIASVVYAREVVSLGSETSIVLRISWA